MTICRISLMMKHIDLFSGIGGFALAAQWAGIETVQFVEKDKFCQAVLRKNFPGVPIHGDIYTYAYVNRLQEQGTEQQADGIGQSVQTRSFLLTGGFPCQSFSVAGKRRGTEDDRYLWPEMFRVIREARPAWVIAENVRGILTIEQGMVFEQVCVDLEGAGYDVQTFIIPACSVNAPHRRDRVWIVAHSECWNATDAAGIGRSTEGSGLCEGEPTEKRRGRSDYGD